MDRDPTDVEALIRAARSVRHIWQATCDAHPHRKESWEDLRCFYDLADALKELGE